MFLLPYTHEYKFESAYIEPEKRFGLQIKLMEKSREF